MTKNLINKNKTNCTLKSKIKTLLNCLPSKILQTGFISTSVKLLKKKLSQVSRYRNKNWIKFFVLLSIIKK